MKTLLLLTIVIFSMQGSGNDSTDTGDSTKTIAINSKSLSPHKYLPHNIYDFSELSDKFISSEGVLGEYGQFVSQAVKRVGVDCFYNRIKFEKLCPKYKKFNNEKKDKFLSFLFASIGIAGMQSSLKKDSAPLSPSKVRFRASNYVGKPVMVDIVAKIRAHRWSEFDGGMGLFSLEAPLSVRKLNGRPQACLQNIMKYAEMKPQIDCAVALFSQFYCDKGWSIEKKVTGAVLERQELVRRKREPLQKPLENSLTATNHQVALPII